MANLRESEAAYDRHNLRVGIIHSAVADVIIALEAERDRLRTALAGLVGADSADELRAMEAVMRVLPAPDADKAAMRNAIHALLGSGEDTH